MTKNLWGTPPILDEAVDFRTPFTVLLEQAEMLEQITDGLLIGRVERYLPPDAPSVPQPRGELELLIVAPALDDYSYVVVTLTYPVTTPYPVTVENDKPITCHSEEELLPVLEKILSSEKIRRVMVNLIAQIYEDERAAEELSKRAAEKRKTAEQMRMAAEMTA